MHTEHGVLSTTNVLEKRPAHGKQLVQVFVDLTHGTHLSPFAAFWKNSAISGA